MPTVSLILPIRNEAKHIRGCLESIAQQDFPHEQMEIIIADGLSSDNTKEVVEASKPSDIPLIWLDNPGKIVPTGLNLAIRQASGEIIIRVDGHAEIAPDYVSRCVWYLQNQQIQGVGGPMESIGENYISEVIAYAMSSSFGVGNSAFRTVVDKTLFVDSIPFPAYTRDIIQAAGLYDEELVRDQDDEYNYRIRELGGKLLLAVDVKSRYYSRASLAKLWKQYFQYGFYKVRVLQKHPRQMSLRHFVPPLFVLTLILSILLAVMTPWGKVLLALVAGSYLLANIIASLIISAKKGWQNLPLLPLTFAILHVSYGSGFLWGLIKFRKRWGDKFGKVPAWNID
ncbi:MAG TPA: glycosyltransferase family 2 protein [Anaerolineaceae bacterium]|nr:glycosyltransferase family 2 protein [Anaerolineaceae bacterium]